MQPFLISLFGLIIGSVVIGMHAQKQKRRTGAGWAALTFLLGVAWYLFFEIALMISGSARSNFSTAWEELRLVEASRWGFPFVSSLIAGVYFAVLPAGIMAIVVSTLPERRSVDLYTKPMPQLEPTLEKSSERRIRCPKCAEAILPAAKVCPHCRSELPVDWANRGSFR